MSTAAVVRISSFISDVCSSQLLCWPHTLRLLAALPIVLFLKQSAAYEVRISDWSSDVCSSDPHAQAPGKARFQPWFEIADFARITITGEDDLLFAVEQGIEGVEELLLRAVLAREKLDVIEQQGTDRVKLALELIYRLFAQGLHHRVEKLFGAKHQHQTGGKK